MLNRTLQLAAIHAIHQLYAFRDVIGPVLDTIDTSRRAEAEAVEDLRMCIRTIDAVLDELATAAADNGGLSDEQVEHFIEAFGFTRDEVVDADRQPTREALVILSLVSCRRIIGEACAHEDAVRELMERVMTPPIDPNFAS